MGVFLNFLDKILGIDGQDVQPISCEELKEKIKKIAVQSYIYAVAVNRIENTFSRCIFKTFKDGTEKKNNDYYAFNISPNRNMDGATFKKKLIQQLFTEQEVLILFLHSQYFIADKFEKDKKTMIDWTFENVESDGYTFKENFSMQDVIYIPLMDSGFKKHLDLIAEEFSELLGVSKENFIKSGGLKGLINMPGNVGAGEQRDKVQANIEKSLKALTSNRNAIGVLPTNATFTNLSDRIMEVTNSREFRNIINDQIELTAMGLGIPPAIMTMAVGERDEQYDLYLSECIDSLKMQIEAAFNKRVYSKDRYLKGDYMLIDTSNLKHVDFFDIGSSVDKWIGSSTVNPNDIRERVGMSPIKEDWANKHVRTKNYGVVDEE